MNKICFFINLLYPKIIALMILLSVFCSLQSAATKKKKPFQINDLKKNQQGWLVQYTIEQDSDEEKTEDSCSDHAMFDSLVINAFMKKIRKGSHQAVINALQNLRIQWLLDIKIVQEALKTAQTLEDDGEILEILQSNELIALLSGPNGPLIMALRNTFDKQKIAAVIEESLFYSEALYKNLDNKEVMQGLEQASASAYSDLIVIPLLGKKSIRNKLTSNQIRQLFLYAVKKNNTRTMQEFLKNKQFFNLLASANDFILFALSLPFNEALDKMTRYLLLYSLLQEPLFLKELKNSLISSNKVERQLQETYTACLTDKAFVINFLLLKDNDIFKYLHVETF